MSQPRTSAKASICLASAGFLLWVLILISLAGSYVGAGIGEGGDSGLLRYALGGLSTLLGILLLWFLLLMLLIIAAFRRMIGWLAAILTFAIMLLSLYAAIEAQELLSMPADQPFLRASAPPWPSPPFRWPLLVPALVPPLAICFSLWALIPSLRAKMPALLTFGLVWASVLALSLTIFPMKQMRAEATNRFYALKSKRSREVFSIPADSPLWDWTRYLDINTSTVISSVEHLARRQSDAEIMLDRGDFPLAYLGSFDLDPTVAICVKARALIQRKVAARISKLTVANAYTQEIENEIDSETWAMQWLASHGCEVRAERDFVVTLARSYRYSPLQSVAIEILGKIQPNP